MLEKTNHFTYADTEMLLQPGNAFDSFVTRSNAVFKATGKMNLSNEETRSLANFPLSNLRKH